MSPSAIFLGSKPGAVAALRLLFENGWDIRAVVASESEPSWLPEPTLWEEARKLGLLVLSSQSGLDSAKQVDLVISYMCRSKVSAKTRRLGKYAINFHAGPLPDYAGWAFYSMAILEGSPVYGCTCHIMEDAFDTGAIVKERHFDVDIENETALSLERRAQIEMICLFREVIDSYQEAGELEVHAQDMTRFRYLNRATFDTLKRIPAEANATQADAIARAFWYPPYEIAYYQLPNGDKVEVIPGIVKRGLAPELHADDLDVLLDSTVPGSEGRGRSTDGVECG